MELFVKEQMLAGAQNTLVLTKGWYSEIDFNWVASGVPEADVEALVEEAEGPTKGILKLLDEEEKP